MNGVKFARRAGVLFEFGLILAFGIMHAHAGEASNPVFELPAVAVGTLHVANWEPGSTFPTPVTALRFEPLVDVLARNMAEGQSDVAIRGGIFEQTGFKVGASSIHDPQTGHYFAEIPIAPAMLGAPEILTGYDNALRGWNAGAGTVAYSWRPISDHGYISVGAGEFSLWRAEFYQGSRREIGDGRYSVGADAQWGASSSQGTRPYGDHDFSRVGTRIQLSGPRSQTDLYAGYQAKFFGWRNLYTPFNSLETDRLQTVLLMLNHRISGQNGDFFEAGGYYRRNKDDYAFNRLLPLGTVHPFQHTTWVYGASAELRRTVGDIVWNGTGTVIRDALKSTSLTAGRFRQRDHLKLVAAPERSWQLNADRKFTAKAGLSYDDTNRDASSLSPLAEISIRRPLATDGWNRLYASFSRTTQTPTYTALNSASGAGLFRGNPDLGREAARNLEVGGSAIWAGWAASAAVFHRWDDGLVDWTYRRGVTARTASPVDLKTSGVELVLRRQVQRLDLALGYTFFHRESDYGSATVDASFYALNFPKHRLTASATLRLGRGWELRADHEFRIQEDNALRREGGDEAIIGLIGAYYSPPVMRGLTLGVQVDNLWNENFEEVPAVPAGRRQVSTGVNFRW
ncbi:MAG: TonB-dependent receptor [Opitutaceae bacterium]|nr:TonB-dependent receptor [Opitutaceae bacterium]